MNLLDPTPYMELTPADKEDIAFRVVALLSPILDGIRASILELEKGTTSSVKKRWLSFKDVCTICGIERPTLYKWIECGQFPPGHVVGSRRKWSAAEVDKAIVRKQR